VFGISEHRIEGYPQSNTGFGLTDLSLVERSEERELTDSETSNESTGEHHSPVHSSRLKGTSKHEPERTDKD
jgi:hypothetical protein